MSGQETITKGFIPTQDGYRNLFSYLKAEIIYDENNRRFVLIP
jgi:hypothetical protein